jgi:hypothetical protein
VSPLIGGVYISAVGPMDQSWVTTADGPILAGPCPLGTFHN